MAKTTTGISVEERVLVKAKAKAKKGRRTFSNYIEGLIIKDLRFYGTNTKLKKRTATWEKK